MASGPRKKGESFKEYRARLKNETPKQPRVLWDSHTKGTYVRSKHGELK